MQGIEVHRVLTRIGATHLHHANSVVTSCTFLEQGGLLSRGFVEEHHLQQTVQSSDHIDKRYDIWNRVFVDHVDIHARGGRKKGANFYGPVLFVFDVDILLGLPAGTDILVTKTNPVHWREKDTDSDRWFRTAEELAANLQFGNFDKMLVIQTPSGKVDFPDRRARIILDDPQRKGSSGEDAYTHAAVRLNAAGLAGRIEATIEQRVCRAGCICVNGYAACNVSHIDYFFG